MKNIIVPCLAVAFAASLAQATPVDDVKAAAKKLADAPNYTWTVATQNAGGGGGGFGGGSVTGVTEKGGYTLITRETQNGSFQTARKGEEVAMQNFQTGEWMSAEEMRQQFANRGGGGGGGGAPGGGDRKEKDGAAPSGGDRKGGGGGGGRGGQRGGGMFGAEPNPAEQVVTLLESSKDLKAEEGAITGTLNEEAVTQRLSFGGRGRGGQGGGAPAAAPKDASGTVKFWVKEGALTKYELHIKGTVNGRNGEMQIDRTTTTEIKNVGSTKVEVPEEAKKKLGA